MDRAAQSFPRAPLAIALVVTALLFACMLTSCFGISAPPQIAATVNGSTIEEQDVTDFIEGFRKKNAQYETDTEWAEFLKSNGYTSETLRSYVLGSVFIPKELIRQQCEQRGIQVSETDLDSVIAQEKNYYEQRYGANSWDSVLASYGYDEDTWRENELNRLLEEQLRAQVIEVADPSDAEIQAEANENVSTYNGKDSYYIQFPSREDAQAAHDALAASGGRVTLDMFSRFGDAVHAGWNSLPANRDAMSIDYTQASNALEAGGVSDPVNYNGSWVLIYCDASFNVGAGGESVAIRTIPAEIYAQIVADAKERKADLLFTEWLDQLAAQSDITIESMPSGLPYNVSSTYEE